MATSSRASSFPGNLSSAPPTDNSDSDNEEAWDEVDVTFDPRPSATIAAALAASEGGGISVVISNGDGKKKGKGKKKSDGSTVRDRMIRQERHKVHLVTLFTVGLIRNKWINDRLLHARLISLVPLHIQNAFTSFNRQTHPNERDRSRLFDLALKDLLSWWYQTFTLQPSTLGIIRRPTSEIVTELSILDNSYQKSVSKSSSKSKEAETEINLAQQLLETSLGESIQGPKSLMRRVVEKRGSKDISAQLFTALCRALGIPARLVFSLQGVDWKPEKGGGKKKLDAEGEEGDDEISSSKGKGKAKLKGKGKLRGKKKVEVLESSDSDEEWEDGRGRLNYTLPPVNLRRSNPTPLKKRVVNRSPSPDAMEMTSPPVFWTEVWSRSNREWITVDPIRKRMRCRGIMEPGRSNVENQLLYVVAYEEDGAVKDVTPRYAKHYNTHTIKARVPSKRGTDWFSSLLLPHKRAFQLNRDTEEDEELGTRKNNEPMPNSIAGFKNHPTYVLLQHLHRDEALLPTARKLGTFRGSELVYPRSSVVQLKSTENYWRIGRIIKDGEIPMKFVKQRNVTINRKRVEELQKADGGEVSQQPLFAWDQTELYVPKAVVDGKIPKNDFGNIDLYVPSMLPPGATHIPNKGAAKCAKTLGIDYTDAITGFEFRQRRANPIITGVVVAEESADLLLEAVANSEEAAEEKEYTKKQERVLKKWKKLIVGIRIRQRIQASYQSPNELIVPDEQESQFGKNGKKRAAPTPDITDTPAAQKPRLVLKLPSSRSTSSLAPPPPPQPLPPPRTRNSTAPERSSPLKLSVPAPVPTPASKRPTRSAIKSAPPLTSEAAKRSTSGRTLRFTMSTETAVQAKEREEAKRMKEAEEKRVKAEEEKRLKAEEERRKFEEIVLSETELEEDNHGSDYSLELDSDF